MKKIIQISLIAVGLSLLTSCTTIGVDRTYVSVPNLNEKLSVGPKLTGSACRKDYPFFFYSTDYKGYALVTGTGEDPIDGYPPLVREYLKLVRFTITFGGAISKTNGSRDPNMVNPIYQAALYDALSKDKNSDLLLDPVYTIDYKWGFFVTKTCFGVTARGVTVN